MKRLTLKLGLFALTSSVVWLGSCRSSDTDHTLSGGVASLSFGISGSDFAGSNVKGEASLGKSLPGGNDKQTQTTLLNPSLAVVTTLSPEREGVSASAGINPKAAISGSTIDRGMRFRILVYDSNGDFFKSEDYTVGDPGNAIGVMAGESYTLVFYSYGDYSPLEIVSSTEKQNISTASLAYNNNRPDLMYYREDNYIPSVGSNTKIVTLRHKVSQIKMKVNSNGLGNMYGVTLDVTPHYHTGVLSLGTGLMGSRGNPVDQIFNDFPAAGSTSKESPSYKLMNANERGSVKGTVQFDNPLGSQIINIPLSFDIKPEYKNNLTINFNRCGAYLGPNPTDWRDFDCFNLGADRTVDPFAPSAGNHGAKYQWGAQTNETGRYYSQSNDQSNSGAIAVWNQVGKPNGSWSDTSKTANDPCPAGYRVPTEAQWQAVISNNNVERVGSWNNDDGNYTTALYFRNPSNVRTLMLPAAGFRVDTVGSLYYRGYSGYYWSSSEATSNAYVLFFSSSSVSVPSSSSRAYGLSVRCIKE